MNLDIEVNLSSSIFTIYWDNIIVHSGLETSIHLPINDADGWHTLVIEAERLNPSKNQGHVEFKTFKINDTTCWPVDAGDTTVYIPFSTLQGYCFTDSSKSYLAYNNQLFVNTYQRVYFLVKDKIIIDHYYDRNDQNDQFYKSHTVNTGVDYNFLWSDVYKKYIHRHMTSDHMIMIYDPNDQSTYGAKWYGPRFEYTETALIEDQARENRLDLFPVGSNLKKTSDGYDFGFWVIPHVFGAYFKQPLPAKLLAPILKRV